MMCCVQSSSSTFTWYLNIFNDTTFKFHRGILQNKEVLKKHIYDLSSQNYRDILYLYSWNIYTLFCRIWKWMVALPSCASQELIFSYKIKKKGENHFGEAVTWHFAASLHKCLFPPFKINFGKISHFFSTMRRNNLLLMWILIDFMRIH